MNRVRLVGAAVALVLAASIAAFATHLQGAFFWDDKVYLLDNPRLARGAGLIDALRFPLAGQVFRPVSTATLWLQVQLFGFSMSGFRVVQLGLHLACVYLLFCWMKSRLGASKGASNAISMGGSNAASTGALVGAAIFLVHPAATEAVMFANARHDLLGALFALLALLVLRDGSSLRRGLIAGACAMLAIGCKESYLAIAPMLAVQVVALALQPASLSPASLSPASSLVEPAPRQPPLPHPLARALAIAVLPALLGAAVVFSIRRALAISASSALSLSLGQLARAYAALILHHVVAFVTFTDAPTAERYLPPSTATTLLVLVIAATLWSMLAWRAFRGGAIARTSWLGATMVLLALLPSIAAIPSTGQYGNRYGYFALAGFATILAALTVSIARWLEAQSRLLRGLSIAMVLLSLLVLAGETWARAGEWRDGLTLFGADVERIPDDSRANYHYGVEVIAARGCADALPYFERAAEEEPDWARPFRNLAGCALRLGHPNDALEPARQAVALEPLEAAHRRNLAAALLATGQIDAARGELAEAERLAPGAPQNEALRRAFP